MAAQLEQRTMERDAAKSELDMAKDTARLYYQRMLQAEAERLQPQTMDSDRFLLVLIDGDSMPFLDEFVSRGMEGGEDAGKHLRNAILEYSKSCHTYRADDRIFIWIYANARGLSRTYKAAKIIPDESVFELFMTGFNRSHQFSDFIDAGPHKEAADAKIKAYFEFFYRNQHCQHVMFGGSADNSYAGFLRPLSLPDSRVNDRITMIEGPPFAADLRKVAQGFRQVSFRTIFRSTKIEVVPNGIHVAAGVKRPASEALTSLRDRQTAKADTAVVARPKSTDANATHSNPASNPTLAPSPIIFQNQYGQRLDAPLTIDKNYLQQLYNGHSRLCNNFYLRGYCPYGAACEWDHSLKLNQLQLDTFRQKARTSNCRNPFCVDPACCLGHMCPRGESCNISQCKFLPEMHNIDVSKIFQYNTETGEKKELKPS